MKTSEKNAPNNREQIPPNADSSSILLVDDDSEMLDLLSQMLRNHGHLVHALSDGNEAMDYARKSEGEGIDLLITDLVMPNVGGLELATWFHENYPKTKILIISGYTDGMIIFQEDLSNHTDFLAKPLRAPAFTAKVSEILHRSK